VTGLGEQLSVFRSPGSILDGDAAAPPDEVELQRTHIAESESALLPVGVVYQAQWRIAGDGMASHARAQVLAIAEAGIPVRLQSISQMGRLLDSEVDPSVMAEVGWLQRVSFSNVVIAVRQLVLYSMDFARNTLLPAAVRVAGHEYEQKVLDSTIVYTSWERDTASRDLIDLLSRCNQLWVPCKDNARAFIDAGMPEEKVHVVPCPYVPGVGPAGIAAPFGGERVPDGKRFYTIGKWEPRKNLPGLLRAFLRGFTPKERVSLALKTSGFETWKDHPSLNELIAQLADDPVVRKNGWTADKLVQRVSIINGKIPEEALLDLHKRNNIYVSAAHGEAFEMSAFAARCAGNRLVYTGWGGPRDFAGHDDVAIEHTMGPVHPEYNWEPDAKWAVYEEEALIEAMRKAEPPSKRIHPPSFNRRFSRHAVGKKMRKLLLRAAQDVGGATARNAIDGHLGSFG
jgi:glycosyltransferase involved in cell wall biosynthesis